MNWRGAVLLAFVVLAGCSSLTVRVDVADPSVLQKWNLDRLLAEGMPRALSELPGALQGRVDALRFAKLQQFLSSRSSEYANLGQDARQDAIKRLTDSFNQSTGAFYTYHASVLESLDTAIRAREKDFRDCESSKDSAAVAPESAAIKPPATTKGGQKSDSTRGNDNNTNKSRREQRRDRAEAELIAANAKEAKRVRCAELRLALFPLLQQREALLAEADRGPDFVVNDPQGPLTSLVGQDGLFREREAYTVANAPEDVWKRNFDRSYSWSLFGDTNVAIKMESRGSFSIKGVSFDPSEITRVASKVVTQSLLAWTQIAGVPTGATARQPGSVPVLLAQNEQEQLRFDSDRDDQSRALLTVADAVAASSKQLASDTDRKGAIDGLLAVWEANKDRVVHAQRQAVPARLTLTPAQAVVAPGESVTLYPAVTEVSAHDRDIALSSPDKTAFVDLPRFTTIRQNDHDGQAKVTASATAPWKDYDVTAALDQETTTVKVLVAPAFDLKKVPDKVLVGVTVPVAIPVAVDQPDGSATPTVVRTGELDVPRQSFAQKALSFDLKGTKDGAGTVAVKTGNASTDAKTVAVVTPSFTAPADTSIPLGQATQFKITVDRKGGVGDLTSKLQASDKEIAIVDGAWLTWGTDETSKTVTLNGVAPGIHDLTVKSSSGPDVVFKVEVKPLVITAEPPSISGDAGSDQPLLLSIPDLAPTTNIIVSSDDAQVATVGDDSKALQLKPKQKTSATIKLVKAGSSTNIVVKAADATSGELKIPVHVNQ